MSRVAAIDCGTNSVRLLVADCRHGQLHPVSRQMRIVRLGEGVDRTGRLSAAALERTGTALSAYAETCRELGASQVRMVATSATRDAANRDEFARLVREVLGVDAEVVSGEEEAALSFAGATRDLPGALAPFLVVDIGGGSTEFVLGSQAVRAARSVDIGCVRLTERHLRDDPPGPAAVAAARADITRALEQVAAAVPVGQARTVVGLAGSVTTVAALALDLPEYDAQRIHGSRLRAPAIRQVSDRLLGMTRRERAALPVMHPGRADVIGAGALILRVVVEHFGLEEVMVSESDILDGIAGSICDGQG